MQCETCGHEVSAAQLRTGRAHGAENVTRGECEECVACAERAAADADAERWHREALRAERMTDLYGGEWDR